MRDHRTDQAPSREFVPEAKPLESRVLLSSTGSVVFFSPLFHSLPRTGGDFAQTGSMLAIGVGQPKSNAVQITDDSNGHIQADWNAGPVHTFSAIATTVIQAERARVNKLTFHLTSPRTGPAAVVVGSLVATDAANPGHGQPRDLARHSRTSGAAVQSGSLLTVTVNRPNIDVVQINNEGGGAVQVEWNGGAAHSFSGVETIVVHTKNARMDQVTLDDPGA
jgi:hypothetical protein